MKIPHFRIFGILGCDLGSVGQEEDDAIYNQSQKTKHTKYMKRIFPSNLSQWIILLFAIVATAWMVFLIYSHFSQQTSQSTFQSEYSSIGMDSVASIPEPPADTCDHQKDLRYAFLQGDSNILTVKPCSSSTKTKPNTDWLPIPDSAGCFLLRDTVYVDSLQHCVHTALAKISNVHPARTMKVAVTVIGGDSIAAWYDTVTLPARHEAVLTSIRTKSGNQRIIFLKPWFLISNDPPRIEPLKVYRPKKRLSNIYKPARKNSSKK